MVRFLNYEEWLVSEVEAGLEEMQNSDFASPEEVEARFYKWGVNAN